MRWRRERPKRADWLRRQLVRFNPLTLTLFFVALLAAVAALLALGLTIDSGDWGSFKWLWRDQAMALLGLDVGAPDANAGGGFRQAIYALEGLLSLVLPALYISVFVFRLFIHPDVFVFRKLIVLSPNPKTFDGELEENGYVLAIRAYNASRLQALEVEFRVYHQRWFGSDADSVVRNVPLPVANPNWPMADRGVPYTLFVKLKPSDAVMGDRGLELGTIRGKEVTGRDRLVVHVCGSMPDVGETFVERHAFELCEDVSSEPYGGIRLQYGKPPETWGGWGDFDA